MSLEEADVREMQRRVCDAEAEIERLRVLLRRIYKLLLRIREARKGSIGSIDNVYLPQLDRCQIDMLEQELRMYF